MEIGEKVLEFLGRKDVQSALARNDTQELYKLAVDEVMQETCQLVISENLHQYSCKQI